VVCRRRDVGQQVLSGSSNDKLVTANFEFDQVTSFRSRPFPQLPRYRGAIIASKQSFPIKGEK
jgi:hypothetical protein